MGARHLQNDVKANAGFHLRSIFPPKTERLQNNRKYFAMTVTSAVKKCQAADDSSANKLSTHISIVRRIMKKRLIA